MLKPAASIREYSGSDQAHPKNLVRLTLYSLGVGAAVHFFRTLQKDILSGSIKRVLGNPGTLKQRLKRKVPDLEFHALKLDLMADPALEGIFMVKPRFDFRDFLKPYHDAFQQLTLQDSNPYTTVVEQPEIGGSERKSPAQGMYERVKEQIKEFEAKLDDHEEIGAHVGAGAGMEAFHIEDLSYWGPDMLIVDGRSSHGRPVQLIQNISQLNILLTALPKQRGRDRPRRIGFILDQKDGN
jgi:hypothetical protein